MTISDLKLYKIKQFKKLQRCEKQTNKPQTSLLLDKRHLYLVIGVTMTEQNRIFLSLVPERRINDGAGQAGNCCL